MCPVIFQAPGEGFLKGRYNLKSGGGREKCIGVWGGPEIGLGTGPEIEIETETEIVLNEKQFGI